MLALKIELRFIHVCLLLLGSLYIEKEYEKWVPRSSETAIEDFFLRRFVTGIYQGLISSEIIIHRQCNTINISFLVEVSSPFLTTHSTSLILPGAG